MLTALIERAKNLLLKPAETWDAIAAEEVVVQDLYKTWILPLAAITPIAAFIGYTVIGAGAFGVTIRAPLANGLSYAVLSYALALGSVYAFAHILDALAPNFGAEKNFKAAFKLAAYFPLAAWLAGVFFLIPSLSVLSVVGLYSLYLLFVGLPKLMKPAADKAGGYTMAAIGVSLVLYLVIWIVASSLLGSNGGGLVDIRASNNARPGATQLERDLRARNDAVERAARSGDIGDLLGAVLGGSAASGSVVETAALRALPPERLSGLRRQSVDAEELSIPFPAVHVTAEYGDGDETITLEITNSPMLSSMLVGFGVASAVYDNDTGDGYERLRRDGDDMIMQEWSESREEGLYGRTLAGEFMIQATGDGVPMRDLERAVNSFNARQLERLPKRED
jgi:hypothetical protein